MAVKSVDGVYHWRRLGIVVGKRHGQQPALPAGLEGMDHPQGQGVVDVTAKVRVEDKSERLPGGGRRRHEQERCQKNRRPTRKAHQLSV